MEKQREAGLDGPDCGLTLELIREAVEAGANYNAARRMRGAAGALLEVAAGCSARVTALATELVTEATIAAHMAIAAYDGLDFDEA